MDNIQPAWMNIDGKPIWRPQSSLQSLALMEQIGKFAPGPERDEAVDKWATEFKTFNVDALIGNYKKIVEKKANPIRALRRKNREEVAHYSAELSYIEPMRIWWHANVDSTAQKLKRGNDAK